MEKRNVKRGGEKHLRALLVGPDREVIEEKMLMDTPESGTAGGIQRVRLATTVLRKGIYGLNVTVSGDRYGTQIAWGFGTNCPQYLIETSRGHRDARHEEPLILLSPDRSGDVCFMPREGEFSVGVKGLAAGVETLVMYDGGGKQVGEVQVDEKGGGSGRFSDGVRSVTTPWRLHFPKYEGVVQIDGLTRWAKGDVFSNLSLWTPNAESWFAFRENRWLLTPYSRTVYAESGAGGEVTFQVHN
ncbi:MAG TPA: hypothetical protein ENH84_07500, partial [Phycisphaerae bacterium]|nr:hypothetical protein [Phycisphaerae bacterium]